MVPSDEKTRRIARRLMMARLRILINHGFYGLLLMHMVYSIDESCETAATDGKRIFLNPAFLENLSDPELDFVLMHEILHVVLQHCLRGHDLDPDVFNIACDIVVNSNILRSNGMDPKTIRLAKYGEAMHLAPDGKEGYQYTAEEVYELLKVRGMPKTGPSGERDSGEPGGNAGNKNREQESLSAKGDGSPGMSAGRTAAGLQASGRAAEHQQAPPGSNLNSTGFRDDHTRWGTAQETEDLRDVWVKRFEDACEAISIRDPDESRGLIPAFAQRLLEELRRPQTDWRTILNEFVQEEITDYSFAPPDRRFGESPFFLPDFSEKDETVKDILFMIDTSGSMSDQMITAAYSEIKGAIDQFNGRLAGWLGFFDAAVIEPKPFSDESEFRLIRPAGGGGTDFQVIFEYVAEHMEDRLPASIIILTDGFAPFPDEKLSKGIPVLWLLNNEKVHPPWGKTARIKL